MPCLGVVMIMTAAMIELSSTGKPCLLSLVYVYSTLDETMKRCPIFRNGGSVWPSVDMIRPGNVCEDVTGFNNQR